MLDLVRKYRIAVFDHGSQVADSGEYRVDAILQPDDIQRLEQAGYQLEQHEDVDEAGKARQKEVGRGDRYKQPG
jgi:hypothetical protein